MSPLLMVLAVVVIRLCVWPALSAASRLARVLWRTRNIPGPASGLLCLLGPVDKVLDKACAIHRKYGHTVRIMAGPTVCILTADPADLEVVFTNPNLQHKPSVVYDSLKPILGEGLITLNGETHRHHRKAIGPSLHFEILQDFVPVFERNSLRLCKQFEPFASTGEEFNATPILANYTANSICTTVFSADIAPEMEQGKNHYLKSIGAAGELAFHRAIQPWFHSDFAFSFSSLHEAYTEAANSSDAFVNLVLDYKMQQLDRGELVTDRRRKAFLDHILTSPEGQTLTREELFEELKTMSGAAVATSTDLMSFFLMVVATQLDVQNKIIEELDDVFGGSDRPVEPEDLPHLQYLDWCLKETMRLFPPVFSMSRIVLKDTPLPSGYVLPEGAIVSPVPYFTHRIAKHFPEPDKFDPSRFSPENSRGRHPYAYIPFSAGVRNCVGQRYAMMSAKVLASSILRRFSVLPTANGPKTVSEIQMVAGLVAAPKDGANVRLQRRGISC